MNDRQPSRILKRAMKHLLETRNLRQEPSAMAAYFILVKAQAECFFDSDGQAQVKPPNCIDELIGPKMREMGISCPCPQHARTPSTSEFSLQAEEQPKPSRSESEPKRVANPSADGRLAKTGPARARNGKMAAAGDQDND